MYEYLNKFFNKYLDMDIEFEMAEGFACDTDDWIIGYNFNEYLLQPLFYKNVPSNLKSLNPIIIALFHEVGHLITHDDFSYKEINEYHKFADNIEDLNDEAYIKYFNHPIELAATKEGMEQLQKLLEKHPEAIEELDRMIKENF